jgi:hypothetical protein
MSEVYAFPFSIDKPYEYGMTLRDYFAGQSLAGFSGLLPISDAQIIARRSYEVAEAMLKEREKWLE